MSDTREEMNRAKCDGWQDHKRSPRDQFAEDVMEILRALDADYSDFESWMCQRCGWSIDEDRGSYGYPPCNAHDCRMFQVAQAHGLLDVEKHS